MHKLMILVLGVGLLAACTEKQKCDLRDKVVSGLTPAVALGLECSNPDAIKASLIEASEKVGLCKPSPTPDVAAQSIGADACKLVGSALVDVVAGNAIPAVWGCKAENAKEKLKEVIADQCAKIDV